MRSKQGNHSSVLGKLSRKQFIRLLLLGTGSYALSACGKKIGKTLVLTEASSETNTPYPSTAIPSLTPTHLPEATTTIPPTWTPAPTAIPTSTHTPTEIVTPTATPTPGLTATAEAMLATQAAIAAQKTAEVARFADQSILADERDRMALYDAAKDGDADRLEGVIPFTAFNPDTGFDQTFQRWLTTVTEWMNSNRDTITFIPWYWSSREVHTEINPQNHGIMVYNDVPVVPVGGIYTKIDAAGNIVLLLAYPVEKPDKSLSILVGAFDPRSIRLDQQFDAYPALLQTALTLGGEKLFFRFESVNRLSENGISLGRTKTPGYDVIADWQNVTLDYIIQMITDGKCPQGLVWFSSNIVKK